MAQAKAEANKANSGGMLAKVRTMVSARVPVIWLLTTEEQRAESGLAGLASGMAYNGRKCFFAIWSLTGGKDSKPGWCQADGWTGEPIPENFSPNVQMEVQAHGALLQARDFAQANKTQPFIMVIRDAHAFMKNDAWRRAVKDLSRQLRETLATLVLLSVNEEIAPDLRRDVAIVRPGLPSIEVLTGAVSRTLASLGSSVDPRPCAMALRGLGIKQANDLINLDYVEHGGEVDPERLSRLKAEELASVHGVSFEGESHQLGGVGGLEFYKAWLRKRRHAFSHEARDNGIDQPKGCVFVGVPGGGKTMVARATAGELKQPLIVLNLSECEGGIVGETATRMAEALRTVDALAPCTVLIDEIEKALGSGGEHDGGSKRTLVRLLLIWLQERTSQVFTCITSNDISGLPPELTRRGRIDEIWFVDLPSRADREQIVRIHLAKRNRSLDDATVAALAERTRGMTGSEIEESVKEGILSAWERRCEGGDGTLTVDDVSTAAKEIVPMSVTYGSKLDALRQWAKGKARRANEADPDIGSATPAATHRTKPESAPPIGAANLFRDALKEPW
jgi:SpoVK/Ycf46/Vps4 family AAA+-type ATPase